MPTRRPRPSTPAFDVALIEIVVGLHAGLTGCTYEVERPGLDHRRPPLTELAMRRPGSKGDGLVFIVWPPAVAGLPTGRALRKRKSAAGTSTDRSGPNYPCSQQRPREGAPLPDAEPVASL